MMNQDISQIPVAILTEETNFKSVILGKVAMAIAKAPFLQ